MLYEMNTDQTPIFLLRKDNLFAVGIFEQEKNTQPNKNSSAMA